MARSGSRGGRDRRPRRDRDPRRPQGTLRRPDAPDQLEGRNVVISALRASGRVRAIWIDERARPDARLDELVRLAGERSVPVRGVPRAELDAVSLAEVHNGVIGFAEPLPSPTLKEVLDSVIAAGREPFVLLLDEVQYEHNLGAILRTAASAGADAVVVPTRRGAAVSPVVQRVAMGGAEVVPVVREGLNSAAATLRRGGVRLVGAEADGEATYWDVPLTGPLGLIIGGEHRGLGPKLRQRCDDVVHIPLANSEVVGSLNASVAAGLLVFERVRQQQGRGIVAAGG